MAFRFEKLTVKGQEALQRAQEIAEQHGHQQLSPLHLLKALLDEEQGIVRPLIQKIGANVGQLETMVASEINRRLTGGPFPFWGCPPRDALTTLQPKRQRAHGPDDIPEFRHAELAAKGAASVTPVGLPRPRGFTSNPH